MKIVGRFVVPVDDAEHVHRMRGRVLYAGLARYDRLEFWAETDTDDPGPERSFRAFGTGMSIPSNYRPVATAPRHHETGLVWHLCERTGS